MTTRIDQIIQGKLARFFDTKCGTLTLSYHAQGAYSTTTGEVAETITTQTVRGQLYRSRRGNAVTAMTAKGSSELTDVQLERQMCVIEANGLTRAPKRGDYITSGSESWLITSVNPRRSSTVVQTYELVLDQA